MCLLSGKCRAPSKDWVLIKVEKSQINVLVFFTFFLERSTRIIHGDVQYTVGIFVLVTNMSFEVTCG